MLRGQDHEEAILRLLRILKVFSHKLKIAICLPLLFKEENVLKILKPTEQSLFKETCNSYNFSNQSSKKDILEEDIASRVDPKLTLLLEVLFAYPEINKLTNELITNVSPVSTNLIAYLSKFIEIVEQRIRTSPAEEKNYRLKLQSAAASLEKSETVLTPLKNTLEEQRKKHHEFVMEISAEIDGFESIIKDTRIKHEESIKKIISNSESEIVNTYLKSRKKQKALKNQIEDYKKELEKMAENHDVHEKNLRKSRFKSEREHMASLIKYDTEMGSLHQTKEDLTEELKNLELEYKKLEGEFSEQATFYTTMKEEKEAVLMRAFAEKLENFSKNRAAKIIQRTWRAYITRIVVFKKKKKSKRK